MSIIGGTIETPCISICRIDRATSVCAGCKRTLQEITSWLHYTDEKRREIMEALPLRRQARVGRDF
jgi:uncharacterized protein